MILKDLPQAVTAIGGLGTAAFGLLEAVKPVFPDQSHGIRANPRDRVEPDAQ